MLVPHTPHGPGIPGQAQFGEGPWGQAGRASVPYIKAGLFLGSLAIPGGAVVRLSKLPKLASAAKVLGELRRPMHTTLAFVYPGSRFLSTTLSLRKAGGAAALGYNLLNPFETLRYAQRREYDKALINFFYPIVGVPIYNLVEGSSSQDLVQNGGPPAPLQVSSTTADILSLGKISRPTRSSSAKRVIRPKSRKGRRKRCPPGHRWNGTRCVPEHI